MTSLVDLTLAEALHGLDAKAFTAVELVESHLAAVVESRPLNAFISETPDHARTQARRSDERRAKGMSLPLDGIPIAIKDVFCTRGIMTTAGSRILDGFMPPYESTVTDNLWHAGAVLLGKTNMDEFAMGSSNVTSIYGPVINPWSLGEFGNWSRALVPGGSSGGSATVVASRCAMAATATDTGGSSRQPASFCGIVGLKPTYGRCSRWGIVAFASSLDQAGVMTRTVRDAALMLKVMAGFDVKDSTSVDIPVPDYPASLTGDIRGVRIGLPRTYRVAGMADQIESLWQQGVNWLTDAGAICLDIDLPHTHYALPTYYIIAPAEASSNLARYDGIRYGLRVEGKDLQELYEQSRSAGFGAEVRRRILIGTYVLSAGYYDAYYLKAQKVRTCIAQDFKQAFQSCDVILTPTTPTTAFAIGEQLDDPVTMYLNDVFTAPASLAGLPGISVPVGLSTDGLPLGLQLIGQPFGEEMLLRVAEVLAHTSGFDVKPPWTASGIPVAI